MDGHDTTHSHHQSILLKVEKELMVSVIESISYGLFSLQLNSLSPNRRIENEFSGGGDTGILFSHQPPLGKRFPGG